MKGELHGRAKVTKKQVNYIRRSYQPNLKGGGHSYHSGSIRYMSILFGLSRRQVKRIITGENWSKEE